MAKCDIPQHWSRQRQTETMAMTRPGRPTQPLGPQRPPDLRPGKVGQVLRLGPEWCHGDLELEEDWTQDSGIPALTGT